ncbi:hypothetical protein HanHA300_Chr05g0190961 [Helianthus annuus]|nr:hypothetical protein HanHA300_Chr05g0190961 [Helianthus annuus]KAJ0585912.1 hypothetical protein HanHA89_Chr05g0206101 [Helianthus annuus]
MAEKNPTQKKRKQRGKAPPGPDQAVINWKEEEFQNLVRGMNFRPEWGAQYPPPGSTALDAPPGFITLYVAFFREGSFRLPITKFTAVVLRGYGLHISQINAIGLPRITHFEFVCRSYRVEPTFDMFNVFYSVSYTSGFYSFQAKTGVAPVHVSQGIPKVGVIPDFAAQDWYRKITAKATAISQLDEMALVGAGMSLLWVPKHPLGQPAYSHKGKFGYSLLNALDPKSAGAMVEAIQADGNPTWLDQIRGRFLHPTNESLSRYADEVLGTAHGGAAEPVHEVVGDEDDAEASVDPSAQLETRKKARTDRSGRREEKPEGGASGSSRKRSSTLPYLDYVVVSDTLPGLGAGEGRQGSDPDDKATLTEHMKKKALDDHKRQLDEQAAALLAAKKAKLQKDVPPAPSESEIDLGVFSGGHGNLLEEIFAASAPPTAKIGKKPRAVDISQITPPTSPPSRTVGLTPPRGGVEVNVEGGEGFAEGMFEVGDAAGGDGGGDGGGDRGKGVEVQMESSETTPQQTIYTKRPPGGGGATSGVVRSPHFERNPDDSWGNPACDDLPHVPAGALPRALGWMI